MLFQHLPKTGGITFSLIVARKFGKGDVFHIRNPQFSKAPFFSSSYGPLEEFAALSVSERSGFKCVLGHMRFGIHEHVPGKSMYVTMLRDPLERVLSHHGQYNAMVCNNEIGDTGVVSLEEYLQLKPAAFKNHQTRFLVNGGFEEMTDTEKFQRAKSNLERYYALVGVTERFDESMLVMNKLMGWSATPYVPQNVGRHRSTADECPSEVIDSIQSMNSSDRALHAYANYRLDLAIADYGPEFQEDLAQLRQANLRKQKRTRLLAQLRSVKRRLLGLK